MYRSFQAVLVLCVLAGGAFGVAARVVQPAASQPAIALRAGVPTELSPRELRDYARLGGRDVFWLGPVLGTRLEVTEAGARGVFVRYVPAGKKIGDRATRYTTVATYLVKSAYRVAVRSGRSPGAVTESLPSGGLAVWRRDRPTSVFLAYPGSASLVEIFAPDPADARRLARSGGLRLLD